ncbi:MAG: disulfide bond formation protein B [Methyloceanibacter sp.]
MTGDLSRLLNALGLVLVSAVLALALADELWFGDLPCPLCILQRAAFAAAGFGLALNLVFGPKPSHYAVTILGAAAGAAIAMRQIVLHIVPGTGSYGDPILGLHLYTWSFMIFALMIIGCAIMLLDDRQFARAEPLSTRLKSLPLLALTLFTVLTLAAMVSTIALCGAGLCPDSPERYLLFQ